MLEQDLKNSWNNSSSGIQISIEHAQLAEELNVKLSSIQKTIRKRDTREIAASVFGIVAYSFILYFIPFALSKIACVLSIVWFVFVIFKFNKSKKQVLTPNLALSLAEQLKQQKTIMSSQVKLLETVAYWYVLPPLLSNILFVFGIDDTSTSGVNWENSALDKVFILFTLGFKIAILAGIAVFYAYIVRLNKKAAKRDLQPIVDNIERLQEQLEMDK